MCIKICVIQLNKLTFKVETIKKKNYYQKMVGVQRLLFKEKNHSNPKSLYTHKFHSHTQKKKKLIKDNIFSNSLHLVALQNLMLRRLIL